MKKMLKVFFILNLIILFSMGSFYLITPKVNAQTILQPQYLEVVEENTKSEELINISECSDEFMENYFEETRELEEKNNKDNILIVTSKEKISDTFGASNIVEGPNNQYILQYVSKEEKDNAYNKLKELDENIIVEENVIYEIADYNSWGVEKTGLDYALEIANTKDLNDVTVAIIDTGCDMDLFNQNYSGKIVETYNVLDPDSDMTDEHGHGTHIAGTIAESTPDNVKILPIKVSTDGKMYLSDVIEAINYIVYYDKADIINMSYGEYNYYEAEYNAIEAATQENIICVAAAGNDNVSDYHYPSAYDNTISVASVDSSLNKSEFSNYGSTITFCAPGTNILSINGTASGTSMAAPHAASAVAILKSYNTDIGLDDTIDLLKRYAIDLGEDGYDEYYGYGFINFKSAEFYDGTNGDKYNVFKIDESQLEITKLEIPEVVLPIYNYGNVTNLMNMKINLYYEEESYITKYLWQLDSFEISGYDPYSYTVQEVTLKYDSKEITFEIDNTGATTNGWEYTQLENNNISITKFICTDTHPVKVLVPEELDGYTVVSLGDSVFESNSVIKSITLPDTITEIGNSTFKNSELQSIDIKSEIINVGEKAFYGMTSLTTINSKIESVGEGAFQECTSLNNITFSENLKVISYVAFQNCYSLKEINIPNSVTTIENYAFDASGLTNIKIPGNVTQIGDYAFCNCWYLQEITLEEGVTEIGDWAFANTYISSIFIPKTVTSIGENPFYYVPLLTTISVDEENEIYDCDNNALIETTTNSLIATTGNIPSGITKINAYAFLNPLEELYIPEGVVEIEERAFAIFDYNSFKKLVLPKSLTTIYDYSFHVIDETQGIIWYPKNLILYVYKDSPAKTFAEENGRTYMCIDPTEIIVHTSKTEYKVFETVDTEGMYLELKYDDGRIETIDQNIKITYNNENESFRAGDTYFTVSTYNEFGEYIEKQVNVTVSKLLPEYTVPTNIEATRWQNLSEIYLPEGFTWMDETEILKETGNIVCKAIYVPKDTTNYETVQDIEITINVKHVELPFKDIYESDWFYPAIEFVYGKGYIVGTSPTTFEPRTKLTRGMIVTILFRIEGANKVSDTMEFPDVLETEYYYEAVRWAKANKVVNGYQDGYFRPNNYITREELACILMNYSKFKNENIELTTDLSVFNDGDTVSAFAQSAMEWAVARGVITGYTDDNTLKPQGTTTRDIAAVMICKYFTNIKQQ